MQWKSYARQRCVNNFTLPGPVTSFCVFEHSTVLSKNVRFCFLWMRVHFVDFVPVCTGRLNC